MDQQLTSGDKPERQSGEWFVRWRWYLRYPIAVVVLAFSGWLFTAYPYLWPVAALFALDAAILARELSLLLLALGALWLVFKLFAALPVSVAIILGALIIAAGASYKGRR